MCNRTARHTSTDKTAWEIGSQQRNPCIVAVAIGKAQSRNEIAVDMESPVASNSESLEEGTSDQFSEDANSGNDSSESLRSLNIRRQRGEPGKPAKPAYYMMDVAKSVQSHSTHKPDEEDDDDDNELPEFVHERRSSAASR